MEADPRQGIVHQMSQALESRHLAWILGLLAMLLSLPTLWTGLINDDFCQRTELLRPSQAHQDLTRIGLETQNPGQLPTLLEELFIAVGPHKNREAFKHVGALPWWTGKDYKVSLLRPIAALTHWIDYQLFPNALVLMHLHSLLWLGITVFLVARLFQCFMGYTCCAGLAALMYALSQNSYFPAMWLANRNQLLALIFGLLALLAHHQCRKQGSLRSLILSGLCLIGSLLCAEGGIATFAYIFAYALAMDQAPGRSRILSLIPAVILIVAWRFLYSLAGYGASGGGFYFDPGSQPLAFLLAAVERGPFLLAGQSLALPPDLFSLIQDDVRWPYTIGLGIVCVIILLVMGPLLQYRRTARFWCMGMVLSIVPVCAAAPMGRNLLFAGVGGFALLAQFITDVHQKEVWVTKPTLRHWLSTGLCWILFLIHVPGALAWKVAAPVVTNRVVDEMRASLDIGTLPDLQDRTLVIVNAPNPASFMYVPYERALNQKTLPQAIRLLAPGFGILEVTRLDEKTIEIQSPHASLLTCQATFRLEMVHLYRYLSDFRAPDEHYVPGDQIALPGLRVRIMAVDAHGNPTQVQCQFDVSLEHSSLEWLQWDWKDECYRSFDIPSVGQDIQLRGPYR
jgi:hypothetical protein